VFESEVEDVATLGGEGAEGGGAGGDIEGEAESEPALAELGLAAEEEGAFGEDVLRDPAEGRELLVEEIVDGDGAGRLPVGGGVEDAGDGPDGEQALEGGILLKDLAAGPPAMVDDLEDGAAE